MDICWSKRSDIPIIQLSQKLAITNYKFNFCMSLLHFFKGLSLSLWRDVMCDIHCMVVKDAIQGLINCIYNM